jgi:hypothetical protein
VEGAGRSRGGIIMDINYLYSITEIQKEHCYETRGSRPVRVLCNDINYYICKYSYGSGFPFQLFNEYLAGCFLKTWQLPVPDFAFVSIKKEHIKQTGYPYHYFEKPCFGSKYMGEYIEVDKFFLSDHLNKKVSEAGVYCFLKIALFDIWMCNEDRHFDNLNLLYDIIHNQFVPIDHAFCFNSANLDKELYLITDNESILNTPFLNRFFNRDLQHKSDEIRLQIIKEFDNDVNYCRQNLDKYLAGITPEWRPDIFYLKSRLQFLFSDTWIKECRNLFTRLFSQNLKSK